MWCMHVYTTRAQLTRPRSKAPAEVGTTRQQTRRTTRYGRATSHSRCLRHGICRPADISGRPRRQPECWMQVYKRLCTLRAVRIKASREDDEFGPPEGEPNLPFPEHVHRLLERAIIDGRLAPGERVTEVELARSLAVSRTPVREAIRVLEAQGLVIRRRGRGTHIAPRTTFDEASVIYRARAPVEGYLTALAAERISAKELRSLSHLQAEFRAALTTAGAPDRSVMVTADSEFHLTIYRASQSP